MTDRSKELLEKGKALAEKGEAPKPTPGIEIPREDKPEPVTETYLGGREEEPEQDSRVIDALKRLEERQMQQDARIAELVRENAAMAAKLHKRHSGLNELVNAVNSADAAQARGAFYNSIRIRQNRPEPFTTECVILLHTHEDPARNRPVPVGINGRVWNLPRGQECVVPVEVIAVLDDARVVSYVKEVDDDGNPQVRRLEYLSYPYTLLDAGSMAPDLWLFTLNISATLSVVPTKLLTVLVPALPTGDQAAVGGILMLKEFVPIADTEGPAAAVEVTAMEVPGTVGVFTEKFG